MQYNGYKDHIRKGKAQNNEHQIHHYVGKSGIQWVLIIKFLGFKDDVCYAMYYLKKL